MTEIKQAKKTKTREALCSCFVTKQMQIKLAHFTWAYVNTETILHFFVVNCLKHIL